MSKAGQKPIDRRIQKTKRSLSESLIALILEKGYEEVTVQHIIDRANVGRSTFYMHYENKDQLLADGPNNLGIELFHTAPAKGNGATFPDFSALFVHAGENARLGKALFGRKGGDVFLAHLKNKLSHSIREHAKHRFSKTKSDKLWLGYMCDAAAGAVVSMLTAWLDDDMPFAAEEIAERCNDMAASMFHYK